MMYKREPTRNVTLVLCGSSVFVNDVQREPRRNVILVLCESNVFVKDVQRKPTRNSVKYVFVIVYIALKDMFVNLDKRLYQKKDNSIL